VNALEDSRSAEISQIVTTHKLTVLKTEVFR